MCCSPVDEVFRSDKAQDSLSVNYLENFDVWEGDRFILFHVEHGHNTWIIMWNSVKLIVDEFFELSSSVPFANLIFKVLLQVLLLYFCFCSALTVGKHHRRRPSKETDADLVGYTV